MHFLCQERFQSDWEALLHRFGERPVKIKNLRHPEMWRGPQEAQLDDVARARLTAADRDFLRRCLFPWDARLHSLVCNNDTGF